MEPSLSWLSTFFSWLVDYTVDISILICLIFVIKLIISKKLPAWWQYSLWIILLLRMIIPLQFENSLNIPNVVPVSIEERLFESVLIEEDFIISRFTPEISSAPKGLNIQVDDVLLFLWLAGVIIFGVYILVKNIKFWNTIKKEPLLTEEKVSDLLEACKNRMNTHTQLKITITDKVKSPALFGYIRPRLLVPVGVLEGLGDGELSYIFMHELGHLKRHDIGVSWIATFLQIFQWFNPLVWIAFHQMRIDQEAACDAFVLSRIQRNQTIDYASTIVGFLENFYRTRKLPAMVGILENQTQIKRRITMIVNYRKYSKIMMFSSNALLVIIAVIFFSFAGFAKAKQEGRALDTAILKAVPSKLSKNLANNDSVVMSEKSAAMLTEVIEKTSITAREGVVRDDLSPEKPGPEIRKNMVEVHGRNIDDEGVVSIEMSEQKTSVAAREIAAGIELTPEKPGPEIQKDMVEVQDKNLDYGGALSTHESKQNTTVLATTKIAARGDLTPERPVPETQKPDAEVQNMNIIDEMEADRSGNGAHKSSAEALKMFKEVYNIDTDRKGIVKHYRPEAQESEEHTETAALSERSYPAGEQKGQKYLGLAGLAYLQPENPDSSRKTLDVSEDSPVVEKIFSLKDVDERVKIVSYSLPRYPHWALAKGIEGRVLLRFIVDKTGNILDPEVLKAEPEGIFEQAALDALDKYRLKPAKKDGKHVKSVVRLPLSFALDDSNIKLARN